MRNKLRKRIQDLGVSQRQVCAALGVPDQNFSNFLNGHRSYSYKRFIKLLKVLGLTVDAEGRDLGMHSPEELPVVVGLTIANEKLRIKDLADECEINRSSLSSFLSGKRQLNIAALDRLINHLELDYVSYGIPEVYNIHNSR